MNNASEYEQKVQVSILCISKPEISVKCRPWKAWFWCPLSTENAVFTFPYLGKKCCIWYPKCFKIDPFRWPWEKKISIREVQKTLKKKTLQTHAKVFQIGLKKRVSKRVFFWHFWDSHSSMVPRASPVRVLGSKTCQNGVQMACPNGSFDVNIHRFCCDYCILVGSPSRRSLALHRHHMYNIRYQFNVYAYLG